MWLQLARQDMQACRLLLQDDALAAIAAFHAQQVVEKLFKALLEERQNPVPKSHDLERLYTLARAAWAIEVDEDNLRLLSSVYLDSRYPFASGLLPSGKPTEADTRRLLEFAEGVERQVAGLLAE